MPEGKKKRGWMSVMFSPFLAAGRLWVVQGSNQYFDGRQRNNRRQRGVLQVHAPRGFRPAVPDKSCLRQIQVTVSNDDSSAIKRRQTCFPWDVNIQMCINSHVSSSYGILLWSILAGKEVYPGEGLCWSWRYCGGIYFLHTPCFL